MPCKLIHVDKINLHKLSSEQDDEVSDTTAADKRSIAGNKILLEIFYFTIATVHEGLLLHTTNRQERLPE